MTFLNGFAFISNDDLLDWKDYGVDDIVRRVVESAMNTYFL